MPETIELLRQLTSQGRVGGGESRANDFSGIKALMFAVFEDGVRCYLGPPGEPRTAAEAWIRSQRSSVFSFIAVSELLGFNPGAVRDALLRLRQELRQVRRVRSYTRVDQELS